MANTSDEVLFQEVLSHLTFRGQEVVDRDFGLRCDDPDCGSCRLCRDLLMAMGVQVEALQATVRSMVGVVQVWSRCDDPDCVLERDLLAALHQAGWRQTEAFFLAYAASQVWGIPDGWSVAEVDGVATALEDATKLCQVAERLLDSQRTHRGTSRASSRLN